MKKLLCILFIFLTTYSFADQLAYISKADADRAVTEISKLKKLYLFCGCCDMMEPVEVTPTKVYTRFTNYESYYEVVIEYVNKEGVTVTEALDLAYVWKKKGKKYKTIGSILELSHDYCVLPKDWKKPVKKED